MPRSPDELLEEGEEAGAADAAEAIALMRQMQTLLSACSLDVAFEAVGNTLVLLAVASSSNREEAHAVIDDEWPAIHLCLESNYQSALKLQAVIERRGATVH